MVERIHQWRQTGATILFVLTTTLGLGLATAHAQTPSFTITQVFSTLDGSLQFVRFTETQGLNGQHHLAGLKLRYTGEDGNEQVYTFPADLPSDQTANLSFVVAASGYGKLPVGEFWGGNYNCCYTPTYIDMPPRFVRIGGGVLKFADGDSWSYRALPTDGVSALYRDGTEHRGSVPGNGACLVALGCRSEFPIAQSYLKAREYYNAARDHYFVTASAPDIQALDEQWLPGWERTGVEYFVASVAQAYPGLGTPVCRFYLPPPADSHFFSASPAECAEVGARFPQFVAETSSAFYVAPADPVSGDCPRNDGDINAGPFMRPIYRLWNQRADSNHRYTIDPAVRDQLIARGYVAEGYGPDRVAFCVP